jgi:hypothetical protein
MSDECEACGYEVMEGVTTQESRVTELEAQLSALWQPMLTAPHGEWILVSTIHDCVWQVCWSTKRGLWVGDGTMFILTDHATGWRAMPQALLPTQDGEDSL